MIAYFSMEIGLRSDLPTYSGGLGVLAGIQLNLLLIWANRGCSHASLPRRLFSSEYR